MFWLRVVWSMFILVCELFGGVVYGFWCGLNLCCVIFGGVVVC